MTPIHFSYVFRLPVQGSWLRASPNPWNFLSVASDKKVSHGALKDPAVGGDSPVTEGLTLSVLPPGLWGRERRGAGT